MRKFAIGCSFFLCLLAGCATQNASAPPPLEVAREDEVTIQHEPKFESIVDTHVINDKYVLVQTQKETFAPTFQLWNKTTNQVDVLPTMPDIVELQHIISPEYFVFSATGRGSESSRLEFPHTV
ncbi:MAG: hypothetical protein RR336_07825, partial [Oscillospiraceae bacterium]